MTTRPRELARLAEALHACGARLDTHAASDDAEPAPEVERVRRLLHHVADDLGRHATVVRRLDDEIELLGRRRERVDTAQLADLRRRRGESEARTRSTVDAATRALVPGGDLMPPSTILRRLTGTQARAGHAYFGRPPVDRAERIRRLTSLLLHGSTTRPPRGEQRPAVIVIPPRAARSARARHRLLRSVADRPGDTGAGS